MPQSDSTPRLPKWPFLVGDAALLAAGWLIASYARHPLSGTAIVSIVICAVAAAVAGAIPFLADYGRRTDAALDERRQALEALGRTTASTAEQIGAAASGFNQVAELAQANLQQAEQVQQHLQKTSAEFLSRLASVRTEEKRKLEKDFTALRSAEVERLESVLERISKAAAEFGRTAPSAPSTAARAEPPAETTPPADTSSEAPAMPEEAIEAAAPSETSSETAALPEAPALPPSFAGADAPASAGKPPRKRPRKLPKPEESSEAPAAPAPEEETAPPAEVPEVPAEASPSEFSQAAPDEELPSTSVSADGATRLIVTAYIGIGNRLFIRGEGPGLSWDKGSPLQFVSIGKWRWESADASAPVRFKLYKNDEIECTTLAAQSVAPGQQQEVVASF